VRKTIITLSLLAVMPALAVEPAYETNYMSPRAAAGAVAGAAVSTRQTTAVGVVSGGGSAATGPSSATSTINEASAPSRVRIENTPDPYAPNVSPTAPCMGGTSAGGSGPGFGIVFGTSWESKPCMILEAARSFEQAGYREDALHIRCQSEYAAAAPSCKALKQ
jgi:hypothetical protein